MRFLTLLCAAVITLSYPSSIHGQPSLTLCPSPSPISYESKFIDSYVPADGSGNQGQAEGTNQKTRLFHVKDVTDPTDAPTDGPIADPTNTAAPPTDAPTDTPTDTPTDAPTDAPTIPPTPTPLIPHYSTFIPQSVIYNPIHRTLFTRGWTDGIGFNMSLNGDNFVLPGSFDLGRGRFDNVMIPGRFWYMHVDAENPVYEHIPDEMDPICMPPQNTDANFRDDYPVPTPAWDVHQQSNRLVYTCQQTKFGSANLTLFNYHIHTKQQQSVDITPICNPIAPVHIMVDQARQDQVYVTCPSKTGCTNVWRVSFAVPHQQVDETTGDINIVYIPEIALALDAVDCPNPRNVLVRDGMLYATCTDNDIVNTTTGVRGYGWVIRADILGNYGGQLQVMTSAATCPFPSLLQVVPDARGSIIQAKGSMYVLCQDGRIITPTPINRWNQDANNPFPFTTILNSNIHCPQGTSITSFQINANTATLYATCSPSLDGFRDDPSSQNTLIKRVLFDPRLYNMDENIIDVNSVGVVRTMRLPGCQLTRELDASYTPALKSFALGPFASPSSQPNNDPSSDPSPQARIFVLCANSNHIQITQYIDNLTPIATLGAYVNIRHQLQDRQQFSNQRLSNANTNEAEVVAPSSTTPTTSHADSKIIGLPSTTGIAVLVVVAVLILVATGMVTRYIRQRKPHVNTNTTETIVDQRV